MRELALKSLLHDRGKLAASIAGVAFAATLLWVQIGLYVGFLRTSSAIIDRVGGEVWVMARGTEVLDNGEAMSPGSRMLVEADPCVERVRGLVLAVVPLRKPSGSLDAAEVVGFERAQRPLLPWSMVEGLPSDLRAPLRVSVDEHDLDKLQIRGAALGARLEVGGKTAHVAGLTRGIRSFALYPYLFTDIDNARQLAGMGDGQAQYWVADLKDPGCAGGLVRAIGRRPELEAHTARDFARITEEYWVFGSGAGAALGFSALFALVVGAVIVGQTLYSITKEHLRELATLKAIGASRRELVAFVGWQAALLAICGGLLGALMSGALGRALSTEGIEVVLSARVLLLGASAVLAMCAGASAPSLRRVMTMDVAEVFR